MYGLESVWSVDQINKIDVRRFDDLGVHHTIFTELKAEGECKETHIATRVQFVWDWVNAQDLAQVLPCRETIDVRTIDRVELLGHGIPEKFALWFPLFLTPFEKPTHPIELGRHRCGGVIVKLRILGEKVSKR
jgi:hypothetical protein